MTRDPTPVRALLLAFGLLLSASSALSADKPKKETSFGGGKGAFLTKEQLRSCLAQQDRVKQQDAELAKEKTALGAAKDELARNGDAMKAKLEGVDRTKAEAVAAYNDEAQARDKQIDAFQASVDAFNAKVVALQHDREEFAKGCQNRRYFDDDEAAIRSGK